MASTSPKTTRPVYNTDGGRICPECRAPVAQCTCSRQGQTGPAPSPDGVVRLKRESKGRKGKGVTLITGVPLQGEALKTLAKTLKQKCGTGGTVKDGVIEIQGEHREALARELRARGYSVKIAGG